ncbi:hypothetical protein SAMN05444161_4652 [Rhizobiales bacterium GAS191]|nr:hypothetical protein SAMN05444161_4652 [Rhizobiales bacterium GAS191]
MNIAIPYSIDEIRLPGLALGEETRARYEAIAPTVLDELVLTDKERTKFIGLDEKDIEGRTIYPPHAIPRQIAPAKYLEIDVQDYSPRTLRGRVARRKLEVAKAYEAAKEAAIETSGVGAAIDARLRAASNLRLSRARSRNNPHIPSQGL